jgi:hypothetical protein
MKRPASQKGRGSVCVFGAHQSNRFDGLCGFCLPVANRPNPTSPSRLTFVVLVVVVCYGNAESPDPMPTKWHNLAAICLPFFVCGARIREQFHKCSTLLIVFDDFEPASLPPFTFFRLCLACSAASLTSSRLRTKKRLFDAFVVSPFIHLVQSIPGFLVVFKCRDRIEPLTKSNYRSRTRERRCLSNCTGFH